MKYVLIVIMLLSSVAFSSWPIGYLPPHEEEWTGKYDETPERTGDPNDIIEFLELCWQNDMSITAYVNDAWGGLKCKLNWDGEMYCNGKVWGGDTQEPLIGGSTPSFAEPFTGGKAWVYKDITLIDFAECWLDDFEPFDFNMDGTVDPFNR
jgi:hypothetical protein